MNPNFYDQDDPILSREDAIAILDTPDEKLDDLIARAEGQLFCGCLSFCHGYFR